MKIAIVSRVVFLGGVTTHLIDLIEGLINQGHDVYLLSYGARYKESRENVDIFNRLLNTGVRFIEIDFPVNKKNKFIYLINLFISMSQFRREIKKNRFDIIHVHTPVLSFMPKLLGLKFIRTRHSLDESYSILDCAATKEIAVSTEIYNNLLRRYSYSKKDLYLIQNGVSLKYYSELSNISRKDLKQSNKVIPLSREKVTIGLVGTFEFNKGHDILLQALSRLPDSLLQKIQVIFVGASDYENLQRINHEINSFKLDKLVEILPFQPLKSIYPLIDILVFPSRQEGFGLVVVEAMLMGCCVIRSNTGGASLQILHGENGYIFENENIEQLKEYLCDLIIHEEKREEFARKAQLRALELFTSETMVQKTIGVYNEMLSLN